MELELIWNGMRRHWLSAFFLLLTLTTLLLALAGRWYLRRRWRRLIETELAARDEFEVEAPLSAEDEEALRAIKELRHQVWQLPEGELGLGVETLSQRALQVIRALARVYHPSSAIPEYEATLAESMQLVRRVATRLGRLASIAPFRLLGERKLSDYQLYYQVYKQINESAFLQLVKRHKHLYRIARWAVDLKNIANPLYWAGRELGREGYFLMVRWFHLVLISQVGKEAMRLYSGRHFQREAERDAALAVYKLFGTVRRWGGPSAREWATLVELIEGQGLPEAELKLRILGRCARGRFPGDLDALRLRTRSGRDLYRKGLKRLLAGDPHPVAGKRESLEQELRTLDMQAEEFSNRQ